MLLTLSIIPIDPIQRNPSVAVWPPEGVLERANSKLGASGTCLKLRKHEMKTTVSRPPLGDSLSSLGGRPHVVTGVRRDSIVPPARSAQTPLACEVLLPVQRRRMVPTNRDGITG